MTSQERRAQLPTHWSGLVDDAAIFPPASRPLDAAVAAWGERQGEWYADLAASFVVIDTKLPDVVEEGMPLSIVTSGGAGNVAGATGLVCRAGATLAGLEIALRDLDDLTGNARRVVAAVDAARDHGTLAEDAPVYVELPVAGGAGPDSADWLAAADEIAARELRAKLRTGGVEAHLFPTPATLAAAIDAVLDRETAFKCTAGLHHAVAYNDPATGFDHFGYLNVLLATRDLFDGAGVDAAAQTLVVRDGDEVAARVDDLGPDGVARTRRWFTSFGCCSVLEPRDDLIALGLLKEPA